MKHALVFCGRSHHAERLMGAYEGLKRGGWQVDFCTCSNSLNLDPHTETLLQNNLPFLFNLDYIQTDDDKRQIDKLTHQTLETIRGNGTGVSITDDWRNAIEPFWAVHSVREACELIVSWRKMLDAEKPDVVLGLHANNFFFRPLAHVAKERHIPVVCFAEGLLRARDQSTQNKQTLAGDAVSLICVWSNSQKNAYLQAGIPESHLAVCGMPHLDHWLQAKDNPLWHEQARAELGLKKDQKLIVFAMPILSRFEGNPQEALDAVRDWAFGKPYRVLIKMHPFDPQDSEDKIKELYPGFMVRRTGEAAPFFLLSDLVLTQHSTTIIEAIAFGKPAVEFDASGVGILESKAQEGVAVHVTKKNIGDLDRILSGELKLDEDRLRVWREENLGPLDSRSVSRVVDEIEKLVDKSHVL